MVNLWYKKNKILNLFFMENFDEVIEHAFVFADRLNIDLLDARIRGNHKWVDKKAYKATNEIVYIKT